ncbi:formyltetrahydrofolate-dependent phosphoribosylglycinamide formyltransferase [Peptoniphilus asaccharolyticus DSM 20463]|uniref:Phosphoribosylglycinamide formyltransferase n=1 Tax=Peptoniphilus asaccharolyticus DSM 20463 TaxID=573058 RepID=A0A1W1V361_PEPAS|nr:phosphoribosylglycinamide formyltransferase [Peptoniphilus asaccharolyticus]MBL7576180.1 phosphoribosylglycinamide formyltransferase [Peptoniphilus asaccharolyticus]SMB87738.1 formyltetrahydrofolate-dependent phosphoribosylglycinamide formyltransferase [Peptoniphilus asaccharolyticus DSM 20463]
MKSNSKLAVFISGRGSNYLAVKNAIEEGKIDAEISIVISNCNAEGLEFADRKLVSNDFDEILNTLKREEVDYILLLGYLKILPKKVIEAYPNRIINIHPSLIPSFCGKGMHGEKVHQAVLDRGCKVTGVTTHFVNEEADAGPIILQECVKVEDKDTAKSLAKRVLEVEHELIVKTVQKVLEESK